MNGMTLTTIPPTIDTVCLSDALEYVNQIPTASVDLIFCDPPYPEVDRHYGRMDEESWLIYMQQLCREYRRVLTKQGSAVIVLQPNSKKVGSMRGWIWQFMAQCVKDWNVVQDVYWWNTTAVPTVHTQRRYGLMRPSVKYCVWLGEPDCYRLQDEIMWNSTKRTRQDQTTNRALKYKPSGHHNRDERMRETAQERGMVTPYNIFPIPNNHKSEEGGEFGHGAATPRELVDDWIRYASVPGGLVCDPFLGSGTTALIARQLNRHYLGCDNNQECINIANSRLNNLYSLSMFEGKSTHDS